jgi:hypothetical protein
VKPHSMCAGLCANVIIGAALTSIAITPLPVFAQTAGANSFNPALSVVLDGQYAHYSRDPADYGMSGFLLSDEAGLAPSGLSLGESELTASANVDDRFYGQLTVALAAPDSGTEVNIEEAFIQTTALPAGFTLKAGRLFSDIGYLNSKHAHAWDFVDQPLVYKAMLGNQYGDDGVQVQWVAPLDLLVELGGEVFRGAQFPAAGAANNGVGTWTLFGHVGGDVGSTQSWRAGVSYLHADAEARQSTIQNGDVLEFTGSSRVAIADFVWKWAEHGNPKARNVVVQGEFLRRQEDGNVVDTNINYATAVFPPPFVAPDYAYRGTQQGFYLQAVYQFIPRWRAGLRYDRLTADNRGPSLGVTTPLNDTSHDPTRFTAMLDFSNSEFSRFRLQAAEDKSQPQSDKQLILQYVVSIGAHGAHQY